jgi:hypothetical protein
VPIVLCRALLLTTLSSLSNTQSVLLHVDGVRYTLHPWNPFCSRQLAAGNQHNPTPIPKPTTKHTAGPNNPGAER